MMLLTKLILAHFIGDFLLQPRSWVHDKEDRKLKSSKLYLHVLLHGVLTLVLLWDLNYIGAVAGVVCSHLLIDSTKLCAQTEKSRVRWFFIDQFLHLFTLILIWDYLEGRNFDWLLFFSHEKLWLGITVLVFLSYVSSTFIRVLMSKWSDALQEGRDESLSEAGKYIGILERLFVFGFVVSGHLPAIGFLLAAKSVFRFGDLRESRDRKLTEYILIGTLLSFGIASGVGMLYLLLS